VEILLLLFIFGMVFAPRLEDLKGVGYEIFVIWEGYVEG
jgi:hypothetical protein